MNSARVIVRWALVVFLAAAGLNHFRDPATYLGMMPPWVPWPELLHRIAGAAEVEASVHARVHEFSHGHLPKRDREKEEEEEEEESDLMIPCSSSCR